MSPLTWRNIAVTLKASRIVYRSCPILGTLSAPSVRSSSGVEQKGLQAHGATWGQIDAQVKTSWIRAWPDPNLGMRPAG
jgi:hypothetical protein